MVVGGGGAGGAAAGAATWMRLNPRSPAPGAARRAQTKRIVLTDRPSQNPAFVAQTLSEGGMVVWVSRPDGSHLAYRLNAAGLVVYGLCDGVRSAGEVAHEFARRTGRPPGQASRCLADLQAKGLVVTGGYLVASANFPEGSLRPARYLHRLHPDDPAS